MQSVFRRLLLTAGIFWIPAISFSETWTISGCCTPPTTYSTFGACANVLSTPPGGGCVSDQGCTTDQDSVQCLWRRYPNATCSGGTFSNTQCTFDRGNNCSVDGYGAGTGVFGPDEGLEVLGNYHPNDIGKSFCVPQSGGGTGCRFEVTADSCPDPVECGAEYTGQACSNDPEAQKACSQFNGLSTDCAETCELQGYSSIYCPTNACEGGGPGNWSLDCLNQCTFHNWEQCSLIPDDPDDPAEPGVDPLEPPWGGTDPPPLGSSGGGPGGGGGTGSDGGDPSDPTDPTADHEGEDFVDVDFAPLIHFMKNFFRGPDMPDPPPADHFTEQLDPLADDTQTLVEEIIDMDKPTAEGVFESLTLPESGACETYTYNQPATEWWPAISVQLMTADMCDVMDATVKPLMSWVLWIFTFFACAAMLYRMGDE